MTPDSKESSPFEIAFRKFREQIEADTDYSDEDWDEYFNIPRGLQPDRGQAYGIANKYADPSKIPEEKNAWAEAAVEKYTHKSGDK